MVYSKEVSIVSAKINAAFVNYLKGHRKAFIDIYRLLNFNQGSVFQRTVWELLKTIPFGKTISYKDLAQLINKPKAFRAVANAIGKNPFAVVVPCHRVICNNGTLGGYAFGIDKKKQLLEHEQRFL